VPEMLIAKKLTKEIDDRPLFNAVDFSVFPGEALQITGRNGSGKTTVLRIISGLMEPSGGEIQNQFSKLAYLAHENGITPGLTVHENLTFACELARTNEARVEEVLNTFKLTQYKTILAEHLSAGLKRRLGFARLILSEADLWLLDEPLTAMDKDSITMIEEAIKAHVNEGGAVIVTTHQSMNLELKTLALS